jgi:hypothetical protein
VPPCGGEVTFEIDKADPQNPTGNRFTGERFEKALNVTLNSVVFRSSGQDLTTAGTYIEMASRVTEPVLLAAGVDGGPCRSAPGPVPDRPRSGPHGAGPCAPCPASCGFSWWPPPPLADPVLPTADQILRGAPALRTVDDGTPDRTGAPRGPVPRSFARTRDRPCHTHRRARVSPCRTGSSGSTRQAPGGAVVYQAGACYAGTFISKGAQRSERRDPVGDVGGGDEEACQMPASVPDVFGPVELVGRQPMTAATPGVCAVCATAFIRSRPHHLLPRTG